MTTAERFTPYLSAIRYTLTNSVVDTATGYFAVDVSGHGTGTYQWYVRGWGPDGLGPWSSNLTFQVP